MILWIEWSIQISINIKIPWYIDQRKYPKVVIRPHSPNIFAIISHTTGIFICKKVNLLIVFYSKIYEILGRAFCIFPISLDMVGYHAMVWLLKHHIPKP